MQSRVRPSPASSPVGVGRNHRSVTRPQPLTLHVPRHWKADRSDPQLPRVSSAWTPLCTCRAFPSLARVTAAQAVLVLCGCDAFEECWPGFAERPALWACPASPGAQSWGCTWGGVPRSGVDVTGDVTILPCAVNKCLGRFSETLQISRLRSTVWGSARLSSPRVLAGIFYPVSPTFAK